jgi:hypothetical protein
LALNFAALKISSQLIVRTQFISKKQISEAEIINLLHSLHL